MNTTSNSRSAEKGFTLVELAIVMIIIGLLIGGILKGQELIANARLASAVSKVKAVDAAINTFRDSFTGLPGDTAAARLPNCANTTMCGSITQTINNRIGALNSAGIAQSNTTENIGAWAQLSAADMMGGVQNAASAANIQSGVTVPESEVPGQLYIGYQDGTAKPTAYAGPLAASRAGHYILLHNGVPATAGASSVLASATTASLTPNQASRIDAKLDDSAPNSGSVLAMGGAAAAATDCSTAADSTGAYNTANSQAAVCGLYIRVQQ